MKRKPLGTRIAELRQQRGLSQSELARQLGVKPQAVQKWEAGGLPRTHRIEAIANVLGVSMQLLVDDGKQSSGSTDNGWPFPKIDRADFDALPAAAKDDIEDYIEMKVSKVRSVQGIENKSAASS
jgi:transcriptional regulator with XRE-family HTH domain